MPYLHLDLNGHYATNVKQQLAERLGEIYSDIMQADPRRMTVTFRELGEGNVWRCGTHPPHPGALLMCELRRGRPSVVREALSKALIAVCNEHLGLAENELNIEFTQHSGDEMYHQWMGRLSEDWNADEENQ
jgi:phenylpyruvate tautomerase PptA (4-oxalocrotonate tautomerase family)